MRKRCRHCVLFIVPLVVLLFAASGTKVSATERLKSAATEANNKNNSLYIEPAKELWSFQVAKDSFSSDALLDLSYLNTPLTKPSQRVTLSSDKNSFALASGESIRFWTINISKINLPKDQIDEQVRFLAKRGVNMVRLHVSLNPKGDDSNLNDIDRNILEQTFRYVAALKKHGVYLTFSPYWANTVTRNGWGKSMGKNWPVPKNSQAENLNSLLFFDPTLRAAYKNWLKILLTETNPYTGKPLKDDPTLAILQLQNEDSLLFWTFNRLRGKDLDTLRQQYGLWLTQKYGALNLARQQWKGAQAAGSSVKDDWDRGLISFADIWQLTRTDTRVLKNLRLKDQTQFLADTMRQFNSEISHYVHDKLGAKVLINAGNWRTASAERLDDLERFSYNPTDIMASNRYVSTLHQGDKAGWAITNGQKYRDASVLLDPSALPVAFKQPAGYPFIVSESGWIPPISFQAEGPFLVSAFQSLNGVDAFFWFAAGNTQWRQPSSANGFLPSLGKWVTQTPMTLGQFPAAAYSYRQGLIQPGATVIQEYRSPEQLFAREKPVIVERHGFDPNRDADWLQQKEGRNGLAFLMGRVEVIFQAGSNKVDQSQIGQPTKDGWITSSNRQMRWNLKRGIAIIDAPSVQGACGFFNGAPVTSANVQLTIANPYACVWVVALDERPIKNSSKLLVQMGTRQFATGWQSKPASWERKGQKYQGREITNIGKAPWQIEQLKAELIIDNTVVKTATILDSNGMASSKMNIDVKQNKTFVRLPEDALYVILQSTKN